MNILVTGANGQLGREMRNVSAGSADRYLFTDTSELDITNAKAVFAAVKGGHVDVIVNCAAYTNVDRAEDDEPTADLLNNRAVATLAQAAHEAAAVLIHVSTDYVFSGNVNTPCREDQPTDPLGAYGRTKLAGEQAVLDFPYGVALFALRQQLRQDHAPPHRRARQPESGVRSGGNAHLRGRSCRPDTQSHRRPHVRPHGHLPLQ